MKEHPAKLLNQEEIVIPASAGMTDEVTFARASENLFIFSAFSLISSVLSVPLW